QTLGRFFFYAIAPLFYNLSIIVSIYVFKDSLGLVGLGIGAAVGAVLQLLIVIIGNYKLNFHYRPRINWRSGEFRGILRNLPARSLDQGIDQVNSVVETHIASSLRQGSITYYNNAYVLSTAPILLIGTAISTAAFPRLNQHIARGRLDLFRRDFLKVLRVMIWLSAPLVVVCFFARGYLARLIFTQGNAQIAAIFGFLTAAIFFRILYSIMSRWFYAQKDTKTPLLVSVFTIGLNIFLAVNLARSTAYDVEGLAIAQSLVATIEVFVLGSIMLYRDRKLFDREFLSGIWRIISVTGFSVVAGFTAVTLYPLSLDDRGFLVLGSKLAAISIAIIGTHVLISALFGLEEVKPIFRRLRQLVLKPLRIN
ncbi:oligosaccharide flippase family protein, partial [Polaromonas sp.]|nr:oligosaccharide flippase family protein [Candidatus Saccharibacteria bacterium]